MNSKGSISSLIEDYHLGKKPEVSFPCDKNFSRKLLSIERADTFDASSSLNSRSYFQPQTIRRSSHFYIRAYKIPEQILNKVCETTIVCDTTSINIFFGEHSFIDAIKREPELIIPYDIVKSVQFFSDYSKLVTNSEECLSPLMMNISSNSSRIVVYSTSATETRDYEDSRHLSSEEKFLQQNEDKNCSSKKDNPSRCLLSSLCFFKRTFLRKKPVEVPNKLREVNSKPKPSVTEMCQRYSAPILPFESVSEKYRGRESLFDESRDGSNTYTSYDGYAKIRNSDTVFFHPPDLGDKAGQSYIFMRINIHKTIAYNKNIKNLLQYKTLNFYLPQCRAILLKRHIEVYFRRPALKFGGKQTESEHSLEFSEEHCSSDSDIFIPIIDCKTRILTEELYISTHEYLPACARIKQLELIYSTEVHGTCLKTMYRNSHEHRGHHSILIFKEDTGNIFGALLSDVPAVCNSYYGDGSCCVFRYDSTCQNIQVYKWAFRNNWFVIGDRSGFYIGGGGAGPSIWINEDLIHGRSCCSATFLNEQLSDNEDFTCLVVELWIFK